MITQQLVLALIDVAKEKGDTRWVQRYWNTWHCQNIMTTYNGKGYGSFCKNRFCMVCVSIRKADMINRYKLELQKWPDIHFLTLTVKAQPNSNLQKWMGGMISAMSSILKKYRKEMKEAKDQN